MTPSLPRIRNMNSILFVSIAFPPKSDAEGLQVAKYLKYLLREGRDQFAVDVVTSKLPTLNMPYDSSLQTASIGIRQSVELPIFENKYTNFLLRKLVPWGVQSPDSKFSFHWQSFRVPNLLHKPPSLIYSRSFPPSSAMMAYKLKQHYKIPWIMHLSDPWADCPLTPYKGKSMVYNQKAEAECFKSADAICVTSQKTLEFYKRKYSRLNKRIEFFPNVFDSEDIVSPDKNNVVNKTKLRIVYTGSLIGDRSPEPFLIALFSLPKEKQNDFEIIFLGDSDRKNKAILDRYRCDCLTYYGVIEYQKALEFQRSADVLLLIDMPVKQPELRVYFLSKILDYIIAKKPILALIENGSESQSVIQKYGLGTCIERYNIESIREHLVWLLSSRDSDYFNGREIMPEYDASYNAKRLIELFKEFLKLDKNKQGHLRE
jgi:glycosyltransferase involved in cell wall biosynthesis